MLQCDSAKNSGPYYKIDNEAQPAQEFKKEVEQTITAEKKHFVKTTEVDSLTRLSFDGLKDAAERRAKHANNQQPIGKVGKDLPMHIGVVCVSCAVAVLGPCKSQLKFPYCMLTVNTGMLYLR